MIRVAFFAEGIPTPQGSHRAFVPRGGRFPVVVNDNPRTDQWKDTLAFYFRRAAGPAWSPRPESCVVCCVFLMPRPASHVTPAGLLRRGAPLRPNIRRADLDKLQRALGDALTKLAWDDDCQIVRWHPESVYSRSRFGAAVEISFLESAFESRLSPMGASLVERLAGCVVHNTDPDVR